MQEDTDKLHNPIQPTYIDDRGTRRFKENAIVELVFRNCPFDLNILAKKKFSQTDWEQFLQLIGYSVSAFNERYASNLTSEAVDRMIDNPQISSDRARVLYLEQQLAQLTGLIRNLTVATFNINAEDLLYDDQPIVSTPVVIQTQIAHKINDCLTWHEGEYYHAGDSVHYQGYVYTCTGSGAVSSEPMLHESSADWKIIGHAGNSGAPGVTGEPGRSS